MNSYYIVSGWACMFYLFFGLYTYLTGTRNKLGRLFLLFNLTLVFAVLCNNLMRYTNGTPAYSLWYVLNVLFWGLYSGMIFKLSLHVAKRDRLLSKKYITAFLYSPVIFICAAETFLILTNGVTNYPALYTAALAMEWLYLFGCPLLSVVNLWLFERQTGYLREKKQVRSIIGATLFVEALSFSNMIVVLTLNLNAIPEMAHFFAAIYTIVFWFSLNRYRLFDVRSLVSAEDIISKVNDYIFIIDEKDIITGINSRCEQALGYKYNDIINKHVSTFISSWEEASTGVAEDGLAYYNFINCAGGSIPVSVEISKVKDRGGEYAGSIVVCKDMATVVTLQKEIVERRKKEDNLNYLNLHDPLTDLYNRRFFEQELTRYQNYNYSSVGIVICDVDGLKFVNDTMGHDVGDKLLIACARIISVAFRERGSIFRIGGDEFAVLLHDADLEDITIAQKRIAEAVERCNSLNQGFFMSISIGYSIGMNSEKHILDIFKEADNNMYREKLNHIKSTRNSMLQGLTKLLEARDFITEGHEERMQSMMVSFGMELGFPENRITDLRLLAQFHDIGKVGITDRILLKPGPLNDKEMHEMRRHSEIGYRISKSIPELSSISEFVLKHHEKWDGTGYPLGIGSHDIPLECRILSIVDAFDAMTNDRPYRKAMTVDKAVDELKRHTGTQFDPQLVPTFLSLLKKSYLIDI